MSILEKSIVALHPLCSELAGEEVKNTWPIVGNIGDGTTSA
jgi:xanthine dehydrogenase iron-sulfur cluster and FAD-binding subunit A